MPKFTSPGAKEAFQERMALLAEWRLDVLADLVWSAMPFMNTAVWDDVAENAVRNFNEAGFAQSDPMFTRHRYSDSFVNKNAILRRSSEIVDKLAESNRFVYSVPFEGVRKAHNRKEIRETMGQAAKRANGVINHYNHRVEYANARRDTEIPLMRLALLPAGD
jgi:hypothetical protein